MSKALLVDRRELCRLLGDVSVSHVIRMERSGGLSKARVNIGRRLVRYDLKLIQRLIDTRRLY